MTNVRVRFAPSPDRLAAHRRRPHRPSGTGCIARHTGGKFILRIEDTDKNREIERTASRRSSSTRCAEYGLDYDEGPEMSAGLSAPYVQSERLPNTTKSTPRSWSPTATPTTGLRHARGTRRGSVSSQQVRGLPTGYRPPPPPPLGRRPSGPSTSERAASSALRVVRLAVPLEGRTTFTGCGLWRNLGRESGAGRRGTCSSPTATRRTTLAAQVDDHLMEISHVLRGEDWIPSPRPCTFFCTGRWAGSRPIFMPTCPMMLGPDKKKLEQAVLRHIGALELSGTHGYLQEAT